MSKINARSPYYLEYVTPTKPTPEFTCAIAKLSSYSIDANGTVTLPTLDYGYIDSFTSTAGDFANNKFAPVGASSTRTVTFKIVIPNGFSNSGSGYLLCSKTAVQQAAACVNGPTANGTIPTQSLTGAGDTNTIDLTSYFNAGTVAISAYIMVNPHPSFVAMSRPTGTTLALTALNVGGTKVVYIKAIDSSPNSCVAIQPITVTVATNNDLGCIASTGVDSAGLTGGSIAQDGTISNPSLIGTIAEIRATSEGSAITSVAANTGSTAQNVTLYFLITVPTGYGNAGASIECSKTFSQSGNAGFAFDCTTTILTNQAIYTDGTIKVGNTSRGVIETTTPIKFEEVSTPTQRSITFNIRVPNSSAYSNANALVGCTESITQPAQLNPCSTSTNIYHIQQSFVGEAPEDFCQNSFGGATTVIASSATGIGDAYNQTVCSTAFGTTTAAEPWFGRDKYYRVEKERTPSSISNSSGSFHIWRISNSGIVTEVWRWNCDGGGNGNGFQI
jgi:hypothetical protein